MGFDLLPAIDLLDGRVVRLRQGDFDAPTRYPGEPAEVAARFVSEGAGWIHVVDLDGARIGRPTQGEAVRSIVERVGDAARVEVAGGLRTEADVAGALAAGAGRVVIGTSALADPSFAGRLVDRHGSERVVVALDVRGTEAVGHGWVSGAAGRDAETSLMALADAGVAIFAVTAVDRDGMLEGPDRGLLERFVALGRGSIVASAGIASLADLESVRRVGCTGAIVGRALYEGRMELADAVELVGGWT